MGAEVFGKRPYDEVRIDEIAERAGVSRALMYHYFPDKRAFFAAVVKDEADRLYESTNKEPVVGLTMFEEARMGVLAYMAYHEQNPEAAWAAYVGLGRSDPVLLGVEDDAKNRQLELIMTRIGEVVAKVPGQERWTRMSSGTCGSSSTAGSRSPSSCAGSASSTPRPTPNARRRVRAHAAGRDRPGARDPRRTGRMRWRPLVTNRSSGLLSVAVGTMAR